MSDNRTQQPSSPVAAQPAASPASPGADATTPWAMPLAAWGRVLRRVWVMIGFHELALLAGGLAFYSFLAITPLIAATVMLYGLLGSPETVRDQMQRIVEVVPADVARLLEDQLMQIVTTSTGVTGMALAIALFFAIYGAMRAASGMMSALNIINEEHETRNILVLALRAAMLTVAAITLAIIGVVAGGAFAWLQSQADRFLGATTTLVFQIVTWLAAILLGSAGFALIMRHGPDRRPAKWRWLAPGALLATLLWITVSFGFSLYVAYISDYNATYGSLSAFVVFLMWLYLSAYGVLLGALVNAEIERQTLCDTTVGPPRPAGQRGAVLADLMDDAIPSLRDLERHKRHSAARARAVATAEP